MFSGYPFDNLVVAVAEPVLVHLLELVLVCLLSGSLRGTPHVGLVLTIVEESAVIGPDETSELFNVHFLDVSGRESIGEGDNSELLRLFIILLLDARAHAVDGVVGSHESQVV